MDSMEWFLGSVAVLTAVLLVGLDTVRFLQRYRVRLGRLLKNLTLTERIEIDLGAWLAVTVILGMNTWYFNESDVGMMAALLLAYIVCDVINSVPLGWWILWKARQSERLDSGIVPELRRTFCYFSIILSIGSVCERGDAEGSGELKEGERDVFKRTGGNFGIGGGMGISSHRGSFLLSYTFVLSETDREGENRNGGCSFFYCSRVGDRSTF